MQQTIKRDGWWLAANLVGLATFLYFSSWTRLEPELRDRDMARGGDGVLWALTSLPVLGLFLTINAIWLALVIRRGLLSKTWRSIGSLLLVLALWTAACALDF